MESIGAISLVDNERRSFSIEGEILTGVDGEGVQFEGLLSGRSRPGGIVDYGQEDGDEGGCNEDGFHWIVNRKPRPTRKEIPNRPRLSVVVGPGRVVCRFLSASYCPRPGLLRELAKSAAQ